MVQLHSLQEAFDAVGIFCKQHKVPEALCFKVNLVCEELVVNLFKYSKATAYELELSINNNNEVQVQIRYQGAAFNPIKTNAPNQHAVEEMDYGGLGLVLVNALAASIHYQYDHQNTFNSVTVYLSYQ